MTKEALLVQIQGLEHQLAVLKAQVNGLPAPEATSERRSFADLFGVLAGEAETTEAELAEVEYRVRWPYSDADPGP